MDLLQHWLSFSFPSNKTAKQFVKYLLSKILISLAPLHQGSLSMIAKVKAKLRSCLWSWIVSITTFYGKKPAIEQSKKLDAGMIALLLDGDKVSLFGMAITGWKPMGITRTVTKSTGTKIFTIDHTPAVEMYLKYLGKEEKKNDQDFNVFEELGFTYPFITERTIGGETVLRTPIKIDYVENALEIDIEMPVGTKFWFTTPPDFDIVDEVLDEA
ncbi:MAG: hypothetical protein EOO53_20840, partial [Gammaproteobacteria bacterium]